MSLKLSPIESYKKHNPHIALIALVKPLPLRPKNLAIIRRCPGNAELCDLQQQRVSVATSGQPFE